MGKRIKTQRLEIKPFSGEDREVLAALLQNTEIKKTFMIPDVAAREALDKMVNTFLALSLAEDRFVRGIYANGELLGFVNDVEIDDGCMELGYVIHPAHWNKGFATEMLRAVIGHLLDNGFSAIRAGAFCKNAASIRVMEKCGMKKCPQLEQIEYRGANHTCVYYEIRR